MSDFTGEAISAADVIQPVNLRLQVPPPPGILKTQGLRDRSLQSIPGKVVIRKILSGRDLAVMVFHFRNSLDKICCGCNVEMSNHSIDSCQLL